MHKVLIVEDNVDLRENMRWALMSSYTVVEADSAQSCIEAFKRSAPDVVCLDMGLDNIPDGGLAIIDQLLLLNRFSKIIVITANTNPTLGPEAVKRGAFDFFNKPVDINQLKQAIDRAIKISNLEQPQPESSQQLPAMQIDTSIFMIGTSEVMKKVFDVIKKLSRTDVNVLITGESGTGKELCARAIHYHSERRTNNFVPINCGAIPENLIESELFGYVKGAFTGAAADKEGLIESAEGGTLLLDEIGEMPKNLQVNLLRFLEDQKIQRVGGTTFSTADVRVIAATNRKNPADDGSSIRNDLYYRLSEFQIDLPPLRERGEDIVHIANTLIEKNRRKFNRSRLHLSSRSEQALLAYSWPGNVRELENKLSRASITCSNDRIEPEDLQLALSRSSGNIINYKDAREAFEKEYLETLIQRSNGNISEAAKLSGISRPTLYTMIKKFDITI
ncbi:MAG: sigma-54-dependent Fis family transcriptional regulator [Chitinispirillaceae bacterium]|nr:sigma-54-dependent Fis family transcriptional regulator [Chitinispirillaceae bacterium]